MASWSCSSSRPRADILSRAGELLRRDGEDDAKAALSAETGLKDAIDQALKGTRSPVRREGLDRLAGEFKKFAATFAEILRLKRDSAQVAQNRLMRNANMLRYKLDDIASNAAESTADIVEVNRGATETGSASGEVLSSAKALSSESTRLKAELDRFMANIRAA